MDEEHVRWQKRDLSAKRFYCWADGIHLEARLGEPGAVHPVIIARRRKARRNSSASPMSARSSQSWRDLLLI